MVHFLKIKQMLSSAERNQEKVSHLESAHVMCKISPQPFAKCTGVIMRDEHKFMTFIWSMLHMDFRSARFKIEKASFCGGATERTLDDGAWWSMQVAKDTIETRYARRAAQVA